MVSRPPRPREFVAPPVDGFDQAEARLRRRRGFEVHHGSDWSLVDEVADVCKPLAMAVAQVFSGSGPVLRDRDTGELALRSEVESLVASVTRLRAAVAEIIAEAKPAARIRGRVAAAVREPGHRRAPEVSDHVLISGDWGDALVELVKPLSTDLAAVLRDAHAPQGFAPAASLRLDQALRVVDHAASALSSRVAKVVERQELLSSIPRLKAEGERRRDTEKAQETLRRLGL